MNNTKRCTKCVVWKGENEFYKDKRHKDGLQLWCLRRRQTQMAYRPY